MASGRQVVERVSNHRVVLNFKLVAVFEYQQGLRLVGDVDLRWRSRWSLSFRPRTAWRWVGIRIRACRLAWAAAIENGGATAVLIWRLIFLLVRHRVTRVRLSYYGIGIWNVDRTTARKELATFAMMATLVIRRVWIYRKQRVDAARSLIGKRVPMLNPIRSD